MSDFKTQKEFRKGSFKKYKYQDPTFLSFALMFDYSSTSSPLLSEAAEGFLKKLADNEGNNSTYYAERLADFIAFKQALKTINTELPWYWQSLKGLERLQNINSENPYMGGDDAKLEIETLESLNLPIAGLMHLYKSAVYDIQRGGYILPVNLRKFRMWVYVTEVRTIQTKTTLAGFGPINDITVTSALDTIRDIASNGLSIQKNNGEIAGSESRPYFMIGIGYCEFDLSSGTSIFADLLKSPESNAVNTIHIKYEKLEKVEARALNGIVDPPEYTKSQMSPSPESEVFQDSIADMIKARLLSRGEELQSQAEQAARLFAIEKKNELEQAIRNRTINRAPTFENIFANAIKKADEATDIGRVIRENVNDIPPNSTAIQVLDKAAASAAINLGNAYR